VQEEKPFAKLMSITSRPDAIMIRGRGSWIWDEDGKRYLDFIQGWAVNCLGHAPDLIREALAEQSARLLTASPALHNRPQLELAALLARKSGLDRVFFCNSGTEANEGAIKLARKWGKVNKRGAFEIITTENAFHGRTLAAMAASGKPGWEEMFPPNPPGFIRVPFGDVRAVQRAINQNTVAVMVEPIQGEAGVVLPREGYLRELRRLTGETGLLLVMDEIQTGMARTGAAFAHQHEGVVPDIMTLGKGLGGGVPIAAVLATSEASCLVNGEQGGTYNGNPLVCAVALAVSREILDPGFLQRVRENGSYLMQGLRNLAARHRCPEVRGRGLLAAMRLPRANAEPIRDRCFEQGLIVNAPRADLLRFMPALNVSRDEVDVMIAVLDGVLAAIPPAVPGRDARQ
jgi:acetylornithine/N-succinyldiaminopimelate aminotransferase